MQTYPVIVLERISDERKLVNGVPPRARRRDLEFSVPAANGHDAKVAAERTFAETICNAYRVVSSCTTSAALHAPPRPGAPVVASRRPAADAVMLIVEQGHLAAARVASAEAASVAPRSRRAAK